MVFLKKRVSNRFLNVFPLGKYNQETRGIKGHNKEDHLSQVYS